MKLLLAGDMCPTVRTTPYFENMDTEALFADAAQLFENNDFNIVNVECAITDSTHEIEKIGPCKFAPPNAAKVLKSVGTTHCLLSNNHTFDFGIEGLKDTVKYITEAGMDYNGIGENYQDSRKNLVLEKDGESVCIIAVCEHEYTYALDDRMGARPFDVFDTPADVRAAKEKYDKVIVIYHGGKEYCRYPSPRLYKTCHALADCGADVVVCQHSHCIGCYEEYNGTHILYGQGNFHFSSPSKMECWLNGMAVKYDTKSHEMKFTFLVVSETGIELAKGEEKERLEREFAERNEILKNGGWKKEWHDFCIGMKDMYIDQIREVFQKSNDEIVSSYNYLGHALDCEAHRDVLMELFPTANSTNEK